MAGLQGKLRRSLQFRLSVWLSVVLLAFALATGVFAFVSAYQEAIELQDEQLRQMAALINSGHLPVPRVERREGRADHDADSDPDADVVVQFLRQPGARVPVPASVLPGLPADLPDGIQTRGVGHKSWRLFVKTLDPDYRVAVCQQTAIRNEIAHDSALRTVLPLLILLPVLLVLVGDLTRKMLRPLKRAALELDQRPEHDLAAVVDTDLPTEVRPFVVAINRLLLRVAEAVAMQQRFVADAAHELRSPLSALSLQAERLEAADMPDQARERLVALRKGILRSRNLIDQLLSFVRVQAAPPSQLAPVPVRNVFRQVLEDLLPLAEAKNIDVGVEEGGDCLVLAQGAELNILVKNLLGNAIRYTPEGGRIDLSVREAATGVVLQVVDTGPGIPEEERTRVFDPFYRVLGNAEVGSGLGLSIVRTIANRMGATIGLDYADQPTRMGLRVQVCFSKPQNLA
ncbi:MAG: ATP-binding protein [Humidesulfovibrio sp.]|nr:ATP-binding protein [Humidesulfovibrio sp.]